MSNSIFPRHIPSYYRYYALSCAIGNRCGSCAASTVVTRWGINDGHPFVYMLISDINLDASIWIYKPLISMCMCQP